MAKPITFYAPAAVSTHSVEGQQAAARLEHSDAILNALRLLQTLHDTRTLDFLRGAFGAGDTVVTQAADILTSPQTTRAIRNLLILTNLLGSIDPDTLEAVTKSMTEAVKQEQSARVAPSVIQTIRRLFSPKTRQVIAVGAVALMAAGAALHDRKQKE